MDDLLQLFIAETRETLEALSGEIVAWEAAPEDRARLDAIFRFVHTVKGSCGFLDLPRLARLSHAAEDVLADIRSGKRRPDRALVSAVLGVVDRIGDLVEAIDSGAPLVDAGEDSLIAALTEGTAPAAEPAPSANPRGVGRSVRLHVDLLDRMMGGMSEMVLARNELARCLRAQQLDPAAEAALERLSGCVADMRDTVTRTRMQRIDALFSALPRIVRDTATTLGKQVKLVIDGADVELDREMIEVMRDPLLHIVRNAIDHGIEAPAARVATGKQACGCLRISARQSGNQILLEVADDGQGIDVERLIRKFAESGTRSEAELRTLDPLAQQALIFEPGLTSRDAVTAISGRGVGMDVVREAIEQIGGRIDLESVAGKGLTIRIQMPLTLSIISALVVGVHGQRFAIPRQVIEEIVVEGAAGIRVDRVGGVCMVRVRERLLPLVHLGSLLGMQAESAAASMLVVVGTGSGSYAMAVEEVLDHEELVVKPASPPILLTGLYAGMTLPDSGKPMLLLDGSGIAAAAGLRFDHVVQHEPEAETAEPKGVPALVFVDLDGARRLVPLTAVDRIERAAPGAIQVTAGQLRVSVNGRILPAVAHGALPPDSETTVLRLTDGARDLAYVVSEVVDIVRLPAGLAPARQAGRIAGAVLLGDEQLELLDVYWLFGEHVVGNDPEAPLCLLAGPPDGWLAAFVGPLLEQSGYRVSDQLLAGEVPSVVLAEEGVPATAIGAGAAVVRLRATEAPATPAEDSIYRYDRAALLSAVAARVAAGGRGA